MFCNYWSGLGIGYLLSIIIPNTGSQIASVVYGSLLNMVAGTSPTLPEFNAMSFPMNLTPYFSYLSFSKYFLKKKLKGKFIKKILKK
jgi:hypothetical protein